MGPSFSPATIDLLGKKEKRRLLANPALREAPFPKKKWMSKYLLNGDDVLRQRFQNFILTREAIVHWTGRPLEGADYDSLLIAWVATWNASSNTIGLAKNRMQIALGDGQQDRPECTHLCNDRSIRAGHDTYGSVFASDAFFPYAASERPVISNAQINHWISLLTLARDRQPQDHFFGKVLRVRNEITALDNREGTEILADAGCIGGVVPYDGNHKDEVAQFFRDRNMSVAFVAPENRGFSKH